MRARRVPEALRAAGLDVRVHVELFPQATQDDVWLTKAGAQRWVVITRDDRIRYNQLEKQAVLAAKLRFLSITSSSLTEMKQPHSYSPPCDRYPECVDSVRCAASSPRSPAGQT
jgi:hypothetical protein